MFELVRLYVILSLFLLHCAVNGFAVLHMLSLWQTVTVAKNNYLKWFFAISIGLLLNILALFVLGLVGCLQLSFVLGLGLIMFMVAMLLVSSKNMPILPMPLSWQYVDALVIIVFLTVTIMAAMHAPGHWDDTMYHLPIARSYLQHEAIIVNEYLRFPLFPQNIELLITLGLMLGGDLMAQAFATLPIFIMAIGLLGASELLTGSIVVGVLTTVTLFVLAPVCSTLGYAYVDIGLALFCWGTALALALWTQETQGQRSYSWLIIAGMLAGGAASTKYFGLVFVMLAGSCLIFIRRDFKAVVIFGIFAMVTGSWWYIRSFIISGDPIHPAGGNIFGYFLWDATDLIVQKAEQATHGVRPGTLNIWGALIKARVSPWIFAIMILAFRKLPMPIRYFRLIFFAYLIFWFFVTQVDRYLAPIYAVGTFLVWYIVYYIYSLNIIKQFFASRSRVSNAWLSFLIIILALTPLVWSQYHKARFGMTKWQSTLEHRAGYEIFSQANKMIPEFGDRIIQLGYENAIYFFAGTAIGDHFGPGRYRNMLDCQAGACRLIAPERMKVLMEGFGAKMLAVSTKMVPKFDKDAYSRYFDFIVISANDLLMVLKVK